MDPGSATAPLGRLLEEAALLVAVLVVCRTRQAVLVVVAGALGGLLLAGAQGTLGGSLSADPLYGFATEGSVVTREQRTRTNERHPDLPADLGQIGIFSEKPVARMNGVAPGNQRRADDRRDVVVGARCLRRTDTDRLIREPDRE